MARAPPVFSPSVEGTGPRVPTLTSPSGLDPGVTEALVQIGKAMVPKDTIEGPIEKVGTACDPEEQDYALYREQFLSARFRPVPIAS